MPSAKQLASESPDASEDLPSAAPFMQLTFKRSERTLDDPALKIRRGEREANPFDEVVKESFEKSSPFECPFPHTPGGNLEEEKKNVYALLRSAAKFHGYGLDVRILNDTNDEKRTLWFQARKPRQTAGRKRK